MVSPLIALMQDQVAALAPARRARGHAQLDARLPQRHARSSGRCATASSTCVYVAPERLKAPGFLDLLGRCRLALFAIDEAHCVSQWGHDFRPDYLELKVLHERFPAVPRLALTATADAPTRREIVERLDLGQGRVVRRRLRPPQHPLPRRAQAQPKAQLLRYLKGEQAGQQRHRLLPVARARSTTRRPRWPTPASRRCPTTPAWTRRSAPPTRTASSRRTAWSMVATIAFGMGIDKPDVRFVVHLDLPKSLEAYYQETGRAGRDGLPAEACMLYGLDDVGKLQEPARPRRDHERAAAPRRAAEARGDARLLRDHALPPPGAAGLFRRGAAPSRAATATSASSGRRASTAPSWRGRRSRPSTAPASASAPATSSTSCAARRTSGPARLGHDRLSVFGVGRDLDPAGWRSVLRQLAALGLIEIDVEGHGGLALAGDCRAVLKGERSVELRRDPAAARPGGQGALGRARRPRSPTPRAEALFQRLRQWRCRPPARRACRPTSSSTTPPCWRSPPPGRATPPRPRRACPGVGAAKLERYGAALLAFMAE